MAQGVIENYTFPSSVDVGVQTGWSIVAHNIGSDGRFAAGIVNVAGNPGDMTIIWKGRETIVPPNSYFRINSVNPVPNCFRINESGLVKFAVAGNYTIKLWAMHEGSPEQWIHDDERVLTVNVSEVMPPEWPVQIQVPFSGRLAPGLGLEAKDSTPIKDVDLTKLLGGKVAYSFRYESGSIRGIGLYIYWNDELMVSESFSVFQVGETITGSFDLGTARIKATNILSIRMSQAPLGYNVCSFDCPIILGFSEEPEQPPGGEEWWDAVFEWLDNNLYWLALSVVGVGVALLYITGPPVLVYQPPGKRGK